MALNMYLQTKYSTMLNKIIIGLLFTLFGAINMYAQELENCDEDQSHEETIKNDAGKIIAKGQMICGKKKGVWDYYYESGRLFSAL